MKSTRQLDMQKKGEGGRVRYLWMVGRLRRKMVAGGGGGGGGVVEGGSCFMQVCAIFAHAKQKSPSYYNYIILIRCLFISLCNKMMKN